MDNAPHSNRFWIRRVRSLRDGSAREREGVCYVEGIRQVLAAREGGHPIEAVLIDPQRLRSTVAWRAVTELRPTNTTVVELSATEFERISSRDNPVGIAAIVQWQPSTVTDLKPGPDAVYMVTDNLSDAGNLGTLMRTVDSLGGNGLIVHGGVDPSHPNALRASLGTAFRVPVANAASLDEMFQWAEKYGIQTVATSARASQPVWQTELAGPQAVLLGNEGQGLDETTIERCNQTVLIPMAGTASSLNVGVAAGIILYEIQRQRRS